MVGAGQQKLLDLFLKQRDLFVNLSTLNLRHC